VLLQGSRIEHQPPKLVVVGSNPTPPVTTCTHHQFEEWLLGHVRDVTAKTYVKRIRLLSKIGDIEKPEKTKTIICTSSVSEARKQLLADAYDYYVQYRGLSWQKPRFTREDIPIFLPLESELDALIANTRFKMSVFLQFLKETGADSGEAWKLRWLDIDIQRKTVNITPTKNHNTRTLPISENLLSRLLRLPRKNERVFTSKNLDKMRWLYERARNLLAVKLENPRIHEIAFKSFRHWKGTQLYHQTKDILHVKWFLGHKRIENTLVYTHLVNFTSNDFVCKVAGTIEEAKALIESGFEFVTEMDGAKLFRKLK
jgi:integrase